MDLLDFFRGKYPWSKLYRLLSNLPAGSLYRASQEMDFETAEIIVGSIEKLDADENAEEETRESKVRSSAGHTNTIEALYRVADAINQQTVTLIAMELPKGKKPPKAQTMPRPVSAVQVVIEEREKEELDAELTKLGIQL